MSNETDAFRRAQGVTLEQLEFETRDVEPTPLGVPTQWRDSQGKVHLQGPDARVVRPDDKEIAEFGISQRRTVCGDCKYFDLETGRKEIIRQRFGERLVREEQWQLKHLGGPIESIGLCGASNGEMATTFLSQACDQYRQRASKTRR